MSGGRVVGHTHTHRNTHLGGEGGAFLQPVDAIKPVSMAIAGVGMVTVSLTRRLSMTMSHDCFSSSSSSSSFSSSFALLLSNSLKFPHVKKQKKHQHSIDASRGTGIGNQHPVLRLCSLAACKRIVEGTGGLLFSLLPLHSVNMVSVFR